MMGENYNKMDHIFKDKLNDYSESAPDGIWDHIEGTLDSSLRAKRVVYYKIAAAIAIFALIGSSFLYFSNMNLHHADESLIVEATTNQKTNNSQAVINKKDQTEAQKEVISDPTKNQAEVTSSTPIDKVSKEPAKIKLYADLETPKQLRKASFQKLEKREVTLAFKNTEATIIDVRKQKINKLYSTLPDWSNTIAMNAPLETESDNEKKWFMGGEFSPLISYRHIAQTDGVNSKDYYNDAENPIMSYTGGLNVQYEALDRLTIQAGVYYTTMGQSFEYISVYANAAYEMVTDAYKDRFINSYDISNSMGGVTFNSPYVLIDEKLGTVNTLSASKAPDSKGTTYNNLNAEIQQNFQYVEVPFLLRYKLIDRVIDLNLIGGLGANFLIGNDVYLKYGGSKEVIGETNGVSSINYNSTLGLGIEYPILDNLNLKIEPSFKYYINEINSASTIESHPYSIGIYTGFNYSF